MLFIKKQYKILVFPFLCLCLFIGTFGHPDIMNAAIYKLETIDLNKVKTLMILISIWCLLLFALVSEAQTGIKQNVHSEIAMFFCIMLFMILSSIIYTIIINL